LGDTITPSADIFLLGITLYEMVTGTRPFKNAENETVFQRIRETKYIPARKMNSTVPKKLDEIIEKCLRKKVEDRYSQVKDLITDLDQFLGAQKSAHTGDLILKYLDQEALVNPTIKYSEVIQPKKGWKKLNWSLILIGGLALFFGFSIGYFVRKPQSEELNSYPQAKSIQSKSKPASLNKNK
jgi:serine/threonine protein kinase